MNISIFGSNSFQNQIMTQLQSLYNQGFFVYTEDDSESSVIISEGKYEKPLKEDCCVLFEINTDTKEVSQYVSNTKTSVFFLKDLPAILQASICLVQTILEKNKQLEEKEDHIKGLTKEEKQNEITQKDFRDVQFAVMGESLDIEGFDSDLIFLPKNQISGDFVMVEKLHNKLFLFFGDVTGHGIYCGTYAAVLYSLAKGYLKNASPMMSNIYQFASYMSKAAFFYHGDNTMSSADVVLCEIDLKNNTAYFCTYGGGAISPIVIKKNGHIHTVFDENNFDKILVKMGEYPADDKLQDPRIVEYSFEKGDSLLFYTDGITELFSYKGYGDNRYTYGPENMIKAVEDAVKLSGNDPNLVVKTIVSDVVSYGLKGLDSCATLESMISDDATIFCIKRKEDIYE